MYMYVYVNTYIHKHVLTGYTPVRVATGLVTAVDRQGGNHITTCSDAAYDSGGAGYEICGFLPNHKPRDTYLLPLI